MKEALKDVQSGKFAKKWIKENETGREWFEATREKEQQQQIEKVGVELRGMMTFLDPVTIKQTSKRAKVPA